jgi:hypothetical protein
MAKSKRTHLTKKELKDVQDVNAKVAQLRDAIVQIALLSNQMKSQYEGALSEYSSALKHQQEVLKSLEERYGNVNVNVNDGTITEVDDDKGDS